MRASAGLTQQQIVSINPDVKRAGVKAGQTILLPAGTLSVRDREILEGIGSVYRCAGVRCHVAARALYMLLDAVCAIWSVSPPSRCPVRSRKRVLCMGG
jgi:hypothetical protein